MIGCQVTVPGENPRRAGGACVTREPRATAGGCGLLARRVGRGLRAASTCSGTAARLQVEVPPRPPDRAGLRLRLVADRRDKVRSRVSSTAKSHNARGLRLTH